MHLDLSENTVFLGSFKDSMKDGAGLFIKYKSANNSQ